MSEDNKILISKSLFTIGILSTIISILVILILSIIILLKVFSDPFSNTSELNRVSSPDSLFDAVLIRNEGGGATVGFSYDLFISKKGRKVNTNKLVLTLNKIDLLELKWRDPRFLEVHYNKANIYYYTNRVCFDYSPETYKVENLIEIRLVPSESWTIP